MAAEQANNGETIELNQWDVLLGRGNGACNYIGNKRFLDVVDKYKAQYNGTRSYLIKAEIGRQVQAEIEAKGGRFLEPITDGKPMRNVVKEAVWRLADSKAAVEKCKQALRENRDKGSPSSNNAAAKLSETTLKEISKQEVNSDFIPLYPPLDARLRTQDLSFGHDARMTIESELLLSKGYGVEGLNQTRRPVFDRSSVGPLGGDLPALLDSLIEQERRKVASLLPQDVPSTQLASLLGDTGHSVLSEQHSIPPQDENIALLRLLMSQERERSSQRQALNQILESITATDPSLHNRSQMRFNMRPPHRPSTAQQAIAQSLKDGRIGPSAFGRRSATLPELTCAHEKAQIETTHPQREALSSNLGNGLMPTRMEEANVAPSAPAAAVDAALALTLLRSKRG